MAAASDDTHLWTIGATLRAMEKETEEKDEGISEIIWPMAHCPKDVGSLPLEKHTSLGEESKTAPESGMSLGTEPIAIPNLDGSNENNFEV